MLTTEGEMNIIQVIQKLDLLNIHPPLYATPINKRRVSHEKLQIKQDFIEYRGRTT